MFHFSNCTFYFRIYGKVPTINCQLSKIFSCFRRIFLYKLTASTHREVIVDLLNKIDLNSVLVFFVNRFHVAM